MSTQIRHLQSRKESSSDWTNVNTRPWGCSLQFSSPSEQYCLLPAAPDFRLNSARHGAFLESPFLMSVLRSHFEARSIWYQASPWVGSLNRWRPEARTRRNESCVLSPCRVCRAMKTRRGILRWQTRMRIHMIQHGKRRKDDVHMRKMQVPRPSS
jgi:hypothetical protein